MTEAGDVPINMGILPVWLFHEESPAKRIKVYAVLDNASGGTFVNEKSEKLLGVEGSNTDLILTTIDGTSSEFKGQYVSFVMGKPRVTPKKTVNILGLELAAATLSLKIGDILKEQNL